MLLTYSIIAVLLLVAELAYFRIADRFNIIDKPNERSSHSTIVLRGGGVIFAFSMIVWSLTPFPSPVGEGSSVALLEYWAYGKFSFGYLVSIHLVVCPSPIHPFDE